MRGSSRLEKGIDNCEETISSLLRPRDSLDGLAAVVAQRQLGSLGSNKSLIQRSVGKFKSFKEDKASGEELLTTPLHLACKNSNIEAVRILLELQHYDCNVLL